MFRTQTLISTATALAITLGCSSYWSTSSSPENFMLVLDDASEMAILDVSMILKRTSDDELKCNQLTYDLTLRSEEASASGTLDFEVYAGNDEVSIEEGSIEEGSIELLGGAFDYLVNSGEWSEITDDACSADLQVILTATNGALAIIEIQATAADTSASTDDDPGPTEFTMSANLSE